MNQSLTRKLFSLLKVNVRQAKELRFFICIPETGMFPGELAAFTTDTGQPHRVLCDTMPIRSVLRLLDGRTMSGNKELKLAATFNFYLAGSLFRPVEDSATIVITGKAGALLMAWSQKKYDYPLEKQVAQDAGYSKIYVKGVLYDLLDAWFAANDAGSLKNYTHGN